MDDNTKKTIQNLVNEPDQVKEIIDDPKKAGDFYQKLSEQEKQYILYAAVAGLIGYGLYLAYKNS